MYAEQFTPQQIREHQEALLQRIRTDCIDLYYQQRISPENVEEVAYSEA